MDPDCGTDPVLILTASGAKRDVVQGLDTGADDYLTKPFDMEELVARVRSLLRRRGTVPGPVLAAGDGTLDTNTHDVCRRTEPVHLAPREYALLEFLLRHTGVAQDRATLIEHVWGEHTATIALETVDVHVAYLRRKLGRDLITTVPGTGYLIPG